MYEHKIAIPLRALAIAAWLAAGVFVPVKAALPRSNCGAGTVTYLISGASPWKSATGIRCVKFLHSNPANPHPALIWYGEGDSNGGNYRVLGHAFYRGGKLVAYNAMHSFYSGYPSPLPVLTSQTRGRTAPTLQLVFPDNRRETWQQVSSTTHRWQALTNDCPPGWVEYRAIESNQTFPKDYMRGKSACTIPNTNLPRDLKNQLLPLGDLHQQLNTWLYIDPFSKVLELGTSNGAGSYARYPLCLPGYRCLPSSPIQFFPSYSGFRVQNGLRWQIWGAT